MRRNAPALSTKRSGPNSNAGEFHAGQFKRLGKGGREVWLQATYNPILHDGKPVKAVIKLAADVTAVVPVQAAQRDNHQVGNKWWKTPPCGF